MRSDLARLYIFYMVARHGSMRKAADLLYVSPPAVTMQIKKMEEQVGLPVFRRVHGQLRLTAQGQGLYERLQPIFEQLDAVDEYIAGLAHGENTVLTLGTHHLPGNYFIPDLIAHVRNSHPELDVRIALGTQDEFLEKISKGQLDIALIIGEPPQAAPLFAVELLLVTAFPELFAHKKCISVRDLHDVPLILQQHGAGARSTVLDWFARCRVQPKILLENLSSDVIKQFLPKMQSIAFIGRFIVQSDLDRGVLQEVKVKEGLPAIRFQLVYKSGRQPCPKVQAFLNGIKGFVPPLETLPRHENLPRVSAPLPDALVQDLSKERVQPLPDLSHTPPRS